MRKAVKNGEQIEYYFGRELTGMDTNRFDDALNKTNVKIKTDPVFNFSLPIQDAIGSVPSPQGFQARGLNQRLKEKGMRKGAKEIWLF
jgi:hypothetical protein